MHGGQRRPAPGRRDEPAPRPSADHPIFSSAITRSTPGPVGLYIVSVGYFVAGLPGAIAGWLAMITPALLIIPLVHFVGRKMEHSRVRTILQTVLIASAGLLLAAAIPLGQDALTGPVTVAIAAVSLVLLLTTKLNTLWIILGAVVISLSASSLGVMLQSPLAWRG